MLKKRLLIMAVVVLAGGALLLWRLDPLGWFGQRHESDLTLYGNVDIRQVELGFRVGSRIAEMRFEEGDPVTAGTLLARLDQQPFRDDMRQAEAEVAAAAADLLKLERGNRPAEIEQARALVTEREAGLANAQLVYERQQELMKRGLSSKQAFDDAMAQKREVEARLASAREALKMALEGFRQEDIAAGRAQLELARARQATAGTALADTDLVAPADGTILTRVREPGAIVAAGATVYTLSLDRPVWVRAYIAEPDLGLIHPGLEAEVYTDTRPQQPYRGRIGFISPVAEFTPKSVQTTELRDDLVYRLRVIVEAPDKALRQGMPVTVRLPGARRPAGG